MKLKPTKEPVTRLAHARRLALVTERALRSLLAHRYLQALRARVAVSFSR